MLSKATPSVFDNKEEFRKYIEKDEINISYYGVSYDDLVREFCDKTDVDKLRKLLNFKFERHSSYNLSSKRLECLSIMIQERAKRFINIINEKN